MMEIIREANLEYESEIRRTPESPDLWINYIVSSRSASLAVCPTFVYSVLHYSFDHGSLVGQRKLFLGIISYGY